MSIEAMKKAFWDYMSAFGQALVAHGIEWNYQQIEADRQARQVLANEESSATQEPVAWMRKDETCTDCFVWEKDEDHTVPLYTHPQTKEKQEPEKAELYGALVAMQDIMLAEAGVRSDVVEKLIARYRAAHGITGETK